MENITSSRKVIVGLSGGVDSSVTAYLLMQQGYEVVGMTMRTWRESEEARRSEDQAVADAKRVADRLGIRHVVVDMAEPFLKSVVRPFIAAYRQGQTPNPCVLCNPNVKWAALLHTADEENAAYIATGHYANVLRLPDGRLTLKTADAEEKDQTYALYRLTQEMLSRTLMPLGSLSKTEVRRIAADFDDFIAVKHDSQEICFIPDDNHLRFIDENDPGAGKGPGNFVDSEGHVLGRHIGIERYTIGQRKNLGIALGRPVYVTGIRPETNEVVIGENADLFTTTVIAKNPAFMGIASLDTPLRGTGKIRYGQKPAPCTVSMRDADTFVVEFDQPVRAVTPGQSVVIYSGGAVMLGGFIL